MDTNWSYYNPEPFNYLEKTPINRYKFVGSDAGSGADKDIAIWEPILPSNANKPADASDWCYLGHVAVNFYNKEPTEITTYAIRERFGDPNFPALVQIDSANLKNQWFFCPPAGCFALFNTSGNLIWADYKMYFHQYDVFHNKTENKVQNGMIHSLINICGDVGIGSGLSPHVNGNPNYPNYKGIIEIVRNRYADRDADSYSNRPFWSSVRSGLAPYT